MNSLAVNELRPRQPLIYPSPPPGAVVSPKFPKSCGMQTPKG